MKTKIKKWTEALRLGEYQQGRGKLNPSENHYCCLGVACKVFIPKGKLETARGLMLGAMLERQTYSPEWLGRINGDFNRKVGYTLSYLNDIEGFTFDEIADLLELVYVHEILE